MSNIHDVMQTCLQEVQNGAEVEAVLERYPELAEQLRPMLQSSLDAQRMAATGPSAEVLRRNRAKLLQHATRRREEGRRTFSMPPAIQRWVMVLALLVLFFFSGTSLVRASSTALPGDSLYAVKRSWEDFTLAFTFNSGERELLEVEHENERLEELHELFANGRTADVDFAGVITRENGDGWWISNILVIVSEQTVLPSQPIHVGVAVRVYGVTRGDGIVLAERLELLAAGVPLPKVEDEQEPETEVEVEEPQATTQPKAENPDSESENQAPEIEQTASPAPTASPKKESIKGTLTSINQDMWKLDSLLVNVGDAEIKGIPVIGATAEAEGYYGKDGVFVASKIEIFNTTLPDGSLNSNTKGEDDNSNLNGPDSSDQNSGNDNRDGGGDDSHNSNQNDNEHHDNENHNESDENNNNG